MARGKVSLADRQRRPIACHTCRRRKQKCLGGPPCEACTKRNTECTFEPNDQTSSDSSSFSGHPPKRRHIEEVTGLRSHLDLLADLGSQGQDEYMRGRMIDSDQSINSEQDEEFKLPQQQRMLPDSTREFLSVGDAVTLPYLQAIRVNVEAVAGQSKFTLDAQRHPIIAPCVSTPDQISTPMLEKKVVDLLMKYYFTSAHGIMNILDQGAFKKLLNSWYSSPYAVDPSGLCLIYLVLAIGLVMAAPEPDSPEASIIVDIQSQHEGQAECFFRNANDLARTVSGFEDGDFWSIQALSLMSVYTLTISKWTPAYKYLGEAVRSAYALGLHKGPDLATCKNEHLAEERNLWRSLFVLDRFLATALGLPVAISEEVCSKDSLEALPSTKKSGKKRRRSQSVSSSGLDACVQASEFVSQALKRVYSGAQISTQVAHEIADACKRWAQRIPQKLDWFHLFNRNSTPAHGMAILHTQLFGCHSIMLFTRPFFLHLFSRVQPNVAGSQDETQQPNPRLDLLSEACVAASMQTIKLVQQVYQARRLPQRSPFVM
ncbi:fungal-specific transcription factor domain-containing protein [Dactylonectria estremocensis]|uniref:Fungal-specific transcription factor domain-containing protein n=1 Tax=Dactylonectria estremocensis TaxID=1079267 RepID=A0A9P9FJ27_9HYPO|nr:fungal-specific transcription factor domain-containing protein [Dactylonectria estremocensis]